MNRKTKAVEVLNRHPKTPADWLEPAMRDVQAAALVLIDFANSGLKRDMADWPEAESARALAYRLTELVAQYVSSSGEVPHYVAGQGWRLGKRPISKDLALAILGGVR